MGNVGVGTGPKISNRVDCTIVFPHGDCQAGIVLINAIDEVASVGSKTQVYTNSEKSKNEMYTWYTYIIMIINIHFLTAIFSTMIKKINLK